MLSICRLEVFSSIYTYFSLFEYMDSFYDLRKIVFFFFMSKVEEKKTQYNTIKNLHFELSSIFRVRKCGQQEVKFWPSCMIFIVISFADHVKIPTLDNLVRIYFIKASWLYCEIHFFPNSLNTNREIRPETSTRTSKLEKLRIFIQCVMSMYFFVKFQII